MIAKNKDLYYDALAESQHGWHEGKENAVPFIKYILGTIIAAYKAFEDRVALVETRLPALEMVRRASMKKVGWFNNRICANSVRHSATVPSKGLCANWSRQAN